MTLSFRVVPCGRPPKPALALNTARALASRSHFSVLSRAFAVDGLQSRTPLAELGGPRKSAQDKEAGFRSCSDARAIDGGPQRTARVSVQKKVGVSPNQRFIEDGSRVHG